VFSPEENICYMVGAPKVLRPRGYWGVELIILIDLALNLCPVSETEPC